MDYMTRLTNVAISSRKAIRYTIFLIIFLMVGRVLLTVSLGLYRKFFPPAPPTPTVKFGALTKIPFPDKGTPPKLTYVLETPSGGLPTDIPTQVKVYFMPKVNPNLLSLDVAKERAKAMGYSGDPAKESDTVYQFPAKEVPSRMKMNIVNGNFSVAYDLNSDPSPLNEKPPLPEVAASEFRSMLSAANILPDDLDGPSKTDFLKLAEGKLTSVVSLSEADVLRVNLFRKPYDEIPSITENPDQGNVWAIIGGSRETGKQIIAVEYHYFPVDSSQSSTYPIKTPEVAFSELQNSKAYIADIGGNKDGDTLKIRKISLAYFDPNGETQFYQPVYVFEGDNNFKAYLPAVTDQYYGQ